MTSMSGHQTPVRGATDNWLTPPSIVEALGPFDLDPCAAQIQPWRTAATQFTVDDDGLSQVWQGFVWMNPPFGPEVEKWMKRLAEHNNGIALVAARTETRWFVETVWKYADAILFLHGRPHFHHSDGTRASANSGVPICLVGYGITAMERLMNSGLKGSYINYWQPTIDLEGSRDD